MAEGPYRSRVWPHLRKQILARDGHACQIRLPGCHRTANCVDHIIPWLAGGAWYDPTNLRAACTHCNAGRANRHRYGLPDEPDVGPSRDW